MMRVLVCGGRLFDDRQAVAAALHATQPSVVIEGGARGADNLGREWALSSDVPVETYHALWRTEGLRAGPLRNQRMLDYGKPDLVIAFPGGTGTADMVRRARKAGVPVREVG